METEELTHLRQRFDILIALTLCLLEHRTEPSELIAVLGRFGIPPRDIASILGMTPNAVRVARHRRRRGDRRSRARAKKE